MVKGKRCFMPRKLQMTTHRKNDKKQKRRDKSSRSPTSNHDLGNAKQTHCAYQNNTMTEAGEAEFWIHQKDDKI
jgi:hypothetical protein